MKIKDTKHRQEEILNQIIKILQKHLNPDKILLFGSRLKKDFNSHSDFDLAVDKKSPILERKEGLKRK